MEYNKILFNKWEIMGGDMDNITTTFKTLNKGAPPLFVSRTKSYSDIVVSPKQTDNNTETPNSYTYITPSYSDKTSKAFKIVQKLMEEKLIKIKSVEKFIEVINKISEVL